MAAKLTLESVQVFICTYQLDYQPLVVKFKHTYVTLCLHTAYPVIFFNCTFHSSAPGKDIVIENVIESENGIT